MGKTYYSKQGIKGLRKYRRTIKSPYSGVSDVDYQRALGDLRAAGHITIENVDSYDTETEKVVDKDNFTKKDVTIHNLKFRSYYQHTGDSPHFRGYLQSGNDSDPKYKIKGWLNQHGDDTVIRIELVTTFDGE